jgi:hypothetical protein
VRSFKSRKPDVVLCFRRRHGSWSRTVGLGSQGAVGGLRSRAPYNGDRKPTLVTVRYRRSEFRGLAACDTGVAIVVVDVGRIFDAKIAAIQNGSDNRGAVIGQALFGFGQLLWAGLAGTTD